MEKQKTKYMDLEELKEELRDATVNCPYCKNIEDDQYTCTICWLQGGNGKINIINMLKESESMRKELLDK